MDDSQIGDKLKHDDDCKIKCLQDMVHSKGLASIRSTLCNNRARFAYNPERIFGRSKKATEFICCRSQEEMIVPVIFQKDYVSKLERNRLIDEDLKKG